MPCGGPVRPVRPVRARPVLLHLYFSFSAPRPEPHKKNKEIFRLRLKNGKILRLVQEMTGRAPAAHLGRAPKTRLLPLRIVRRRRDLTFEYT